MKKKLSLFLVAFIAMAAYAVQFAVNATKSVTELTVISEATTWDFSKLTINKESARYNSKDDAIKLDENTTPSINDEVIYADYADADITIPAEFNADAIAFKGQYPIRKNKYSQNGELHFKTSVPGNIIVKFSDTGSTPSATAVKRYLVVNGEQTEYWSSRENNGDEPYAAQLNVTTGEIAVPAGDVVIKGTAALQVSYISFTPSEEPQPAEASYYVVGTMNEWKANDAYKLATNEVAEGEYMTTLQLTAGDELKVLKVEGDTETWYPDGMDNNLKVEVSGEYDVYFRPDGQGGQDWYLGYIYLALKDEPAVSYNVHLADNMVNGTYEADKYEVAAGEQVLLKVTPNDGFDLDQLTVATATGAPIETQPIVGGEYHYSFVMPGEDVYVSATFKEQAPQPTGESIFVKVTEFNTTDSYIIVDETKKYVMGTDFKGTEVTITDGTIPYSESLSTVKFAESTAEGYYTIKFTADNGQYLGWNSGNNLKGYDAYTADNCDWSVSFTDAILSITSKKDESRKLQSNKATGDSNNKFAPYTSKQNDIAIYKLTTSDEPQPGVEIKSMAIVGDFLGLEATGESNDPNWDPANGWEMTQSTDNPAIWTYVKEGFVAEAKKYEYKAVANGKWGDYELPAEGNQDFVFGTDMYPAGTYNLTFTANTSTHELTLDVAKDGISTVKELNALANGTKFKFLGNAIVVAKMEGESSQTIDNYIYIKDETGSSLIYDKGGAHSNESDKTKGLLVGDVITAPWNGTVSIYKNLFEVRPAGDEQLTASENVGEVTYPEATPDDVTAENVNKVVEIKGLTIYNVDGKNIKFTIGDDLVNGWNQFGIELPEVTEGKTFDVVGAISRYNDNIQFQPFTITEVVPPVEDVYSVAGSSEALFGTTWNEKEGNEMTLTEGKYTWSKEKVALPAGDVKFKVVKNHSWNENWPNDDYVLNIPETAEYTVTITFDETTKEVSAQATKTGEAQVDDVVVLAGVEAICGSNWNDKDEANKMTESPTAAGLFTITKENLTLDAGSYEYKVVLNGTWYPEANNATVVIENAGIYKIEFTFNKETKEMNAVPTKTGDPAVEKDFSVSFTTDKDWEKVYAYVWNSSIQAPNKWPGVEIQGKEGVYTYEFKLAYDPDFIIFNNGTEAEVKEQTADLPFENGAAYTLTTEKTTAYVGDPEEAIPATTGIAISEDLCKYANVQATNIVRIKASEVGGSAPARAFDNAATALSAGDISVLKGKVDEPLVADELLNYSEGVYEFTATAEIAAEMKENGFRIKPKNDKQIAIESIEVEQVKAPEPVGYYVVGTMTDPVWTRTDAYKLATNPEVEGEYMLETSFAANAEIKVQASDETWYPAGTDNNWVITEAGDYTVYFRPAGNTEWTENGYFTVIKKAPEAIVYDFAAEQALIAAGTITKPTNVGGSAANGQAFWAWEKADKTDSKRQDYKGYGKVEGSTLPDECHIWRRSDRFDQDASWNVVGGVTMPNDREFAIDGLTPGSKVVIEYTAATEGDQIIWATGDGSSEGLSLRAAATISGAEAVSGETAIPSGAEILVTKVTPADKGTGYIVVKVKKNMVISKITVTVNEDAKAYAVNVSDAIENGTVKVNRPTAYAGDEVVVTATPAEGYKLEAITVTGVNTDEAVVVTDGKFIMPADAVNVSATFKDPRIVYDFAAEQALIAAGTITKPTNVGGSAANGQAFWAWEKADKTDSKRQDYKGYGKVEGSTLPDECHIWRRSDRFDQDASWNVVGGVTMPNDREFAIDGLTPGSKVVIEYTAATEGDQIIWATGDGSSEGLSLRAAATISGAEAVSGETAIPSGAEILVTKVTPADKGTGYIVVKVKKNMVISKITVTVNEDAKAYAVNVSDAIENGTVKVNRPTAYAGDEVVVTATPAEGYKLEAITVTGVNTNEAVVVTDGKFTMIADDVTVSATFVEKLDYYLVGNMTDWKPNAEYKLTANTAAEGVEEYMITVDLAADAQFKIAKSNGTTIDDANWYPSGMGNNYGENGELQGAGKYTVYFRPNADGGDDWFYHVIFAQKFYNITVVNCDGMTITPEVTEATAGTKVWADVAMTEGYEPVFPGFTNTDTGDVIEMTEGTDVGMDEETGKVWIIMPAQNLTITAKAAKVSLITLDLSQENGSATCISVNKEDPTSFYKKEGKEIYLTVTPDAGYTADITVTAGEDPVEVIAEAGTYHEQAYTHKFIMPAKDVTVKVVFTKADAIDGIATDDADDNAPIYNLAGQKVGKNYKGVVIKNGKKIYQK